MHDVPAFESFDQHLVIDPVTKHELLKPSPTCMEKIGEVTCGHGVYIKSQKEIFVGEQKEHWFNGKPWSQIKAESVLLPAEESYAPLLSDTINMCAKMNCDTDVSKFKVKLNVLNLVGGKK